MICYSDTQFGGKPCTGSPANWIGVGGTSASSPLMAAFQALVNEKWKVQVGNPNPTYYSIAAAGFGEKGNRGGVCARSPQAIRRVTMTAGGSGYSSAPKCTIAEPSNNSPYFSPEGVPIYSGGERATCTATV